MKCQNCLFNVIRYEREMACALLFRSTRFKQQYAAYYVIVIMNSNENKCFGLIVKKSEIRQFHGLNLMCELYYETNQPKHRKLRNSTFYLLRFIFSDFILDSFSTNALLFESAQSPITHSFFKYFSLSEKRPLNEGDM